MPRRKTTAKTGRKRGRPRGRASGTSATHSGLLRDMEQYRSQLVQQRQDLDDQITAMDQALRSLGMKSSGGRAIRDGSGSGSGSGSREGSLKHYISEVLGQEPMSVKEITEAVLNAGYETKNKTLATSVGLALADMPNVKKVARGTYVAS